MATLKAYSCMASLIFGFVSSKHKAGMQQTSGGLRQGEKVLGLQGLRGLVNGRGAQEQNVMLGM